MDGPKMPLSSEGESRYRHELKLVPVLSSQAPSPPFYGNPSAEERSSSPQGGCDRGFQQQRELLFFLKAHSALLFLEDTTAPCMLQPQRPLLKAHAPLSGSSTTCKLLAACAFCAEKQTTVKIGVCVCEKHLIFLFWRPASGSGASAAGWSMVSDAKLRGCSSVTVSTVGSAWILNKNYLPKAQPASVLES